MNNINLFHIHVESMHAYIIVVDSEKYKDLIFTEFHKIVLLDIWYENVKTFPKQNIIVLFVF